MTKKLKKYWPKIRRRLPALGLLIATILLIWGAFGTSFRDLLPLIREGDGDAIVTYLSGEDAVSGMISVMLLSAIQVASIIMPGMAIQIAAGVLYNWWKGFLLCYTGFVAGNMAVFWFVRHLGKSSSYDLDLGKIGTKVLDLLRSEPPMYMVAVAFMVPGIPNGIVPYIAAKTKMDMKMYFIATALGSCLQILLFCVAGDFLIRGNIMVSVLMIILQWVWLALFIWKKDWIQEKFPIWGSPE